MTNNEPRWPKKVLKEFPGVKATAFYEGYNQAIDECKAAFEEWRMTMVNGEFVSVEHFPQTMTKSEASNAK